MNRHQAIASNMVAVARRRGKKKKGSARSQMLRMIMPMLSQENGEKLAQAIQHKNVTQLRHVWDAIKHQLSEKLAAEASASPKEFSDIFDSLFKDIEAEMVSESAAIQDMSKLIMGNARIPRLTRQLMANGIVTFTDVIGSGYTLRITKVDVRSAALQPTMTVTAELVGVSQKLTATGEYASACSELVVSALSLGESD